MTDQSLDLTTRTTVKDLQRRWGEVADKALIEPVVVTSNGRPRHVLMSVAEYQRLVTQTQKAWAVRDLPEPLMMLLEDGLTELRGTEGPPDREATAKVSKPSALPRAGKPKAKSQAKPAKAAGGGRRHPVRVSVA